MITILSGTLQGGLDHLRSANFRPLASLFRILRLGAILLLIQHISAAPRQAVPPGRVDQLLEALTQCQPCQQMLHTTCRDKAGIGFPPLRSIGFLHNGSHITRSSCPPCEIAIEITTAGPDAIPSLLSHLDDARPIGAAITLDQGARAFFRKRAVYGNPRNTFEVSALGANAALDEIISSQSDVCKPIEGASYSIRLGDVCFEMLGQIVNRQYFYSWPEFAGTRVICSPVDDSELCDIIRSLWGENDVSARLKASLKTDLTTRNEVFESHQGGAAQRLLFYFSDAHSIETISELLSSAQVSGTKGERVRANGYWIEDLCWALGPFGEPQIVNALQQVFDRSIDERILAACMFNAGLTEDRVKERAVEMLSKSLAENRGDPVLLEGIARRFPDDAHLLTGSVFSSDNPRRLGEFVEAFRRAGVTAQWLRAELCTLLDDERGTDSAVIRLGPLGKEAISLRVCDVAAIAIVELWPDGSYDALADVASRSKQIETLRRACLDDYSDR